MSTLEGVRAQIASGRVEFMAGSYAFFELLLTRAEADALMACEVVSDALPAGLRFGELNAGHLQTVADHSAATRVAVHAECDLVEGVAHDLRKYFRPGDDPMTEAGLVARGADPETVRLGLALLARRGGS
ncbi:MAG: hypothetical protein U0990_08375 [Candidatus Nanopelagicales bacterium]|nr:hypothetical protein [Candidatus Nanopelagicales bacterium]MDZ4250091.1 hypothetical protein [Candidatus Nanopelagicales bacterium]